MFLYERPELAKKMGEEGHQLVKRRHSQEQHLEELERIYESLAARQNAPIAKSLPDAEARATELPRLRIGFIGGRGVIGKYSGIETCYEEVGARLAQMGHQVTAYCRSYFTPKARQYRGMRVVRLPTIRTKHLETLVAPEHGSRVFWRLRHRALPHTGSVVVLFSPATVWQEDRSQRAGP
jgi:hypothetical protein